MRVLIGQLFTESNSFNRSPTGAADFAVLRGPAILHECAGQGTTLGGIVDALAGFEGEDDGVDVLPAVAACARPGGPVEHAVYRGFADELVAAARGADVVLLDLHGAMVTPACEDCEGELLARLRAVAPRAVIAAGLDLHGHLTDAMFDAADILVACKNNPHDDCHAAGRRTARLALAAARGEIAPLATRVRLPAILFGDDETTQGPLAEVQALARSLERGGSPGGGVLDVSVFTVQAPLDVADMAQVVTVLADGRAAEAEAEAVAGGRTVAEALNARRERFRIDFPALDEALNTVAAGRKPFALSDFGDRVLAGAAGDGTQVLRALLARGDLRAAVPVTDPDAVAACWAAGVGARVSLAVGGRYAGEPPAQVEGEVVRLHDGRFRMDGPWLGGVEVAHGRTAVVRAGNVRVIATERSALSSDTAFFRTLGIDVSALDLVVVKSGFHFKPSFAGVATPITAATTGPGMYDPARGGLRRARVWPEVDAPPTLSEPRVRRTPAAARA